MGFEAFPLDRDQRSAARLRKEPRSPVAFTCQLRIGHGAWRPASMVDLSCQGFRLSWLPECSTGRKVWVRMPGLEAKLATVRSCDHRGVGCEFDTPLHAAVIDFLSRTTVRPGH